MSDYSQYQGPSQEWVEFTKTTTVPEAGPAPGQSIEDYQRVTNAGREKLSADAMQKQGLHEKVSQRDFEIPTRDGQKVPARLHRPAHMPDKDTLPLFIFFHGGGYFFGTLSSEDARCSKIAHEVGIAVLNVCYRHTPTAKYPTQYHDAWDAFEWVTNNYADLGVNMDQIITGGISSGGSLAASITLEEHRSSRDRSRIRGQILCVPSLVLQEAFPFHLLASKDISSYEQNIHSPILPKKQRDLFFGMFDAKSDEETPYGKWAKSGMDLTGMPRTAVLVAGMDALRDEALLYSEELKTKGVPAHVHIFPGVPHGFQRYEELSATQKWEEVINESIKWILSTKGTNDEYSLVVE